MCKSQISTCFTMEGRTTEDIVRLLQKLWENGPCDARIRIMCFESRNVTIQVSVPDSSFARPTKTMPTLSILIPTSSNLKLTYLNIIQDHPYPQYSSTLSLPHLHLSTATTPILHFRRFGFKIVDPGTESGGEDPSTEHVVRRHPMVHSSLDWSWARLDR